MLSLSCWLREASPVTLMIRVASGLRKNAQHLHMHLSVHELVHETGLGLWPGMCSLSSR